MLSITGQPLLSRSIAGETFYLDNIFDPIRLIGRGSYGIVISSNSSYGSTPVAIKKNVAPFTQIKDAKRTLREIKLMIHCKHDNLLHLTDTVLPASIDDFHDVYMVTDLMDTDMHQIIRSKQGLSNDHYKFFLYQMLKGLHYLHSANIIHRDMKPGNILLNKDCSLKICDFGLARESELDLVMTQYVVTRWYRPPELLLLSKRYTTAVDLWSVGCIFAEMLLRKPLFPGSDYLNQIERIIDVLGTPHPDDLTFVSNERAKRHVLYNVKQKIPIPLNYKIPNVTDDALDLLKRMLVFNPDNRITAMDALRHPYMKSLFRESDLRMDVKPMDFSFENEDLDIQQIKQRTYDELYNFKCRTGGIIQHDGAEAAMDTEN